MKKAVVFDPSLYNTFQGCEYGKCSGWCCRKSVKISSEKMEMIMHHIPKLREYIKQDIDKSKLFERVTIGNAYTSRHEKFCVFFNNGCSIHKYCLDYGIEVDSLKPDYCLNYPIKKKETKSKIIIYFDYRPKLKCMKTYGKKGYPEIYKFFEDSIQRLMGYKPKKPKIAPKEKIKELTLKKNKVIIRLRKYMKRCIKRKRTRICRQCEIYCKTGHLCPLKFLGNPMSCLDFYEYIESVIRRKRRKKKKKNKG